MLNTTISKGEVIFSTGDESAFSLECESCRNGEVLDFDFSMAFQPLVDLKTQEIFGYEALVRGLNGEGAGSVFANVNGENLYRFDQTCRVKAVVLAAKLNLPGQLNINFMPGAVYRPEICIRNTLKAAEKYGFPIERITFEVVENEIVKDPAHLTNIVQYYKKIGFRTALDDFGAGYSGLTLLAHFQPDYLKLDMQLIRDIHTDKRRQSIVKSIAQLATQLGIELFAEGIECAEERDTLFNIGITRHQGYFYAKPGFEVLPEVTVDKLTANRSA